MEVIGHILLALFVGLVICAALSFGLVLLGWFIGIAIAISVLMLLRNLIGRWWFLYVTRDKFPKQPPNVIDAEYRDISDRK